MFILDSIGHCKKRFKNLIILQPQLKCTDSKLTFYPGHMLYSWWNDTFLEKLKNILQTFLAQKN